MTLNGQRMSKTLGTIVDPIEAADRLGVDPLRLYLVKEVAFGGDGDFSWERYDERYNVDLANNLGNLVSRVTSMAHRYRQGRLSPPGASGNDQLARLGESGGRRLPRGDGSLRAARGRRGGVPADRRRQRVHRGDRAVGAGQGSGGRRSAVAGAVRRRRSDPPRRGAARADHAGVEPRDPAPRRRVERRSQLRPRRPLAPRRRAHAASGRAALAAQGDHDCD